MVKKKYNEGDIPYFSKVGILAICGRSPSTSTQGGRGPGSYIK